MKYTTLLLILSGSLIGMVGCTKGNSVDNSLNGKWQEVKLRTYQLDSGKIIHDTTDVSSFTNLDYAQFNSNGVCEISTFEYYFTPNGVEKSPQSIDTSKYNAIGNGKFVINTLPALPNPAGFITNDTVSVIDTHNILIHSVFNSHVPGYSSVTDSYYQK